MHLYDLPACLALISSAFVCVVVHVTQKGYLIRCDGDTFGYPCSGASTTLPSLKLSCPHQWKGSTGCGHLHRHPLPISPAVVSSRRQRLSIATPRHRGGRIHCLCRCQNHVRQAGAHGPPPLRLPVIHLYQCSGRHVCGWHWGRDVCAHGADRFHAQHQSRGPKERVLQRLWHAPVRTRRSATLSFDRLARL